MPTVDFTRPTVEMLADPSYHHPFLSMFPPSRSQLRAAHELRATRRRDAKFAAAVASRNAEQDAKAQAEAAGAAEQAATDKATEEAEQAAKDKVSAEQPEAKKAGAEQAARDETVRSAQQGQQPIVQYCYTQSVGQPQSGEPIMFVNGKLVLQKPNEKKEASASQGTGRQKEPDSEYSEDEKPTKEKASKEKRGQPSKQQQGTLDDNDHQKTTTELLKKEIAKPRSSPPELSSGFHYDYTDEAMREFAIRSSIRRPAYNRLPSFDARVSFGHADQPVNQETTDAEIAFESVIRPPFRKSSDGKAKLVRLTRGNEGKVYDRDGNEVVVETHGIRVKRPQAKQPRTESSLPPAAADTINIFQDTALVPGRRYQLSERSRTRNLDVAARLKSPESTAASNSSPTDTAFGTQTPPSPLSATTWTAPVRAGGKSSALKAGSPDTETKNGTENAFLPGLFEEFAEAENMFALG